MTREDDFLPYSRPLITESDVDAVVEAMRSSMISQGERLRQFEEAFAARVGAGWAVALSSGTAALHAACHAAGLGDGDEVIVPALTFAGTANAVRLNGARPVFADIDDVSMCISASGVRPLITERTKAILAVDFAGHPAPYDELRGVCSEHGLLLLSDSAHAPGAQYRGRPVGGGTADIAVFSLNPVKNITGAEGGVVTGGDASVRDDVTRFRVHGMTRDPRLLEAPAPADWYYEQQFLGLNYKLSELHAALALSQLRRLDEHNSARRAIAAVYDAELADLPLRLPVVAADVEHAWHLYVIRLREPDAERRDELFRYLRARNLGVQLHYVPVPMHPDYRRDGYTMDGLDNTNAYFRSALSLPCHQGMTESDADRVVGAVRSFF